jgi:ABC-2 type transport system ATP-binding protein
VLAALNAHGVEVAGFSMGSPTLDEVFLALTGHAADAPPEQAEQAEQAAAKARA